MTDQIHRCSKADVEIGCIKFAGAVVNIDTTLGSSFLSSAGKKQEINMLYVSGGNDDSGLLKHMELEMRVLPELNWQPLGQPPPQVIEFVSPISGQQDIQFQLKAHGREVSKGSAQIWIDRPVTADVVHFTCPESAIVRQYFSCNLTVESANMVHGKVTWEGQQSEDFTLSKSRSDFIGTPNLYSGPSLPDCRLTDAVITGTQAMYAGTISEIFITLKAPTRLKLFIFTVNGSFSGIQSFQFQKPIPIMVGDRIGVLPDDFEAIDCTSDTMYAPADFQYSDQFLQPPSEGMKLSGLNRIQGKRFKISAALTIPKFPMLFLGRFEKSGVRHVTASIYKDTQALGLQEKKVRRFINVIDPLDDIKLLRTSYTFSKSEVLELKDFQGGNSYYLWNFGDGSPAKETRVPEVRHTFVQLGKLTVELQIRSRTESVTRLLPITVFEAVALGALTGGPPHSVSPQVPLYLSVTVLKGTELTYEWFVDERLVQTTKQPNIQYTFVQSGVFNVTVNVSNVVGWQVAETQISVFSTIQGLTLVENSIPVDVKSNLRFTYTDGEPTLGAFSIDKGLWTPATVRQKERIIETSELYFSDIGEHIVLLHLNSSQGDVMEAFEFWVECAPDSFFITITPKQGGVKDTVQVNTQTVGFATGATIIVSDGVKYNETRPFDHLSPVLPAITFTLPPYTEPGIYTICGTIFFAGGHFTECANYICLGPLGTYNLVATSESVPLYQDLTVSVLRVSGLPSPLLTVEIDWGDGSRKKEIDSYAEGTPIQHTYLRRGNMTLKATVQRGTEEQSLVPLFVVVGPGISDFGCSIEPKSWVRVGQNFEIHVFFKSAEAVNVTLNGGGLSVPVTEIVHANNLFKKECKLSVETQFDVADFTAELATAIVGPPGVAVILVKYTGTPKTRPNKVRVLVGWVNDTQTDVEFPESADHIQLKHKMLKDGNQILDVTVENKVSSQTFFLTVGYFKPLLSANIEIVIDELNVLGYGAEQNTFTIDDNICFKAISFDGTIGSTHLVVMEQSSAVKVIDTVYSTPSFVSNFNQPGVYTVTANLSNPLNYYIVTKTIIVQGTVRGMRLSPLTSSIHPGMPGQVQLAFIGLANSACICVDLGNGEQVAYSSVGGTSCIHCPNYPTMPRKPAARKFRIPVTYLTVGGYTITASVNDTVTKLKIFVTPTDCYPPLVWLDSFSLGNPNTPAKIKVLETLTIIARSNGTRCEEFKDVVYKWEMWKLNEMTAGRTEEKVELPQVPSRGNLQVYITADVLRVGMFEVQLMGWREGEELFSAVSAFVSVSEMPLAIRFTEYGSDIITVSEEISALCLSPAKYSVNPNIPNAEGKKDFKNWQIVCLQYLGPSESAKASCKLPQLPGMENGDFCIDRSFLNFSNIYEFQAMAESGLQRGVGKLKVYFVPGKTPILKIRMARPQLALEGHYDDATSVSQTIDLVLEGECTGDCGGNSRWTLEKMDSHENISPLSPTELAEASTGNVFLPTALFIQNVAFVQQDHFLAAYDVSTLVVRTAFLEKWDTENYLHVCFSHTTPSAVVAKTCRLFFLVQSPQIGSCKFNSSGEITRDTIICINCDGKEQDRRPAVYLFQEKIKDIVSTFATSNEPSYCGKLPYVRDEFELCVAVTDTLGSIDERCYVRFHVSPHSQVKGSQIHIFQIGFSICFKVESSEDIFMTLQKIANDTDGAGSHALATGNPNDLSVNIQSISRKVVETESFVMWLNLFVTVTQDNSTSVIEARKLRAADLMTIRKSTSFIKRNSMNQDYILSYYNCITDFQVVEKLVDATENLPMNDPNTFKLSISTLNSLSQTAVDMPQSAQIKLTKILQNASQVFDEISRFASREDSIHSGNSVLSMVLNILNGTTSQLDSPIATDVVTNSLDMNYDTDLEAMGVVGTTADDQYLLLSKEETRKHQEAASAALFVQLSQLQGNVAAAVSPILTADEVGISSVTPFGKIHMRKMRKSDVQNWLSTFYSSSSISSLTFNGLDAFFNDTQDVFAHTMITLPKMFAFADANPKSIPVQSETVGLSFYKDGKEVRVNEIPGVVTVKIIRDPTTLPPPFTMVSDIGMPQKLPEPLVAVDGSEIYQPLIMTGFDIEQEDVSFSFEIQPTNASTKPQYLVVARFVYPPDLTKLEDDWGLMWAFVPPSADIYAILKMLIITFCKMHSSNRTLYLTLKDDLSATLEERERNLTFFIDNHDFKLFKKEALQRTKGQRLTQRDLNKLWVGFRQLNKQEVDQDWTEIPLPYANRDQINTTINYRGFVTTCEFLEKDSAKWDTKGCLVSLCLLKKVDRQTTAQAAVCVCNHLTTFAAGWIVVPNTVDFNYIFRNIQFEKNATLYVTEITVGIIFLLLFIWARRMDNKDIQKLGITPLAENNPADEYLYEIIVGTGMRRRAGTTSTVCMQLNGEKGGTPPFTLRDPHRKVLQRGNTDRFLLATAKLNKLQQLRDLSSDTMLTTSTPTDPTSDLSHSITNTETLPADFDTACRKRPSFSKTMALPKPSCRLGDFQIEWEGSDIGWRLVVLDSDVQGDDILQLNSNDIPTLRKVNSRLRHEQRILKTKIEILLNSVAEQTALVSLYEERLEKLRIKAKLARPLGDLRFLRIWHDNTGQGSGGSWFCDFVITIDLQTKSKYTFLVEKWLAVDEDDGMVDRVIPVAGPLDRLRPYYLFSHKVTQDASDKHLWASVFTRPAYSRFTRVERVGCCLLVLFLTMVSSCMFYKAEGPAVVDFEFSIGPFALTPYVAFTGVVSCLITFVPVSVVMMLFRKSRLRVNHMTLLRDVVEEHLDEELDDNAYDTINEEPQQSYLEPPRYSSVFQNHSSLDVDQPPPYSENPEPPGKRLCEVKEENESKWKDFTLPWQTRILAWILLILGIVTSVVFTTFYGVTFGDAACKQWLSSLFLSFFLDLFLTQPAKVVLFALFFAVICKSKATAEDFDFAKEDTALMNTIGRRYRLNYGEEYLHDDLCKSSDNYVVSPPDPETLERARVHRQNQRRMHGMLREILFFFLFFSLLIIVSNGFRDPMANRLRESLSSLFFSDDDFEKINSIDDLWDWIEKTLLPNLRASRWYNGHPPLDQRGFIGDRKNRIMGYATMRQVRIRQGEFIWTQDENDYLPGWIPSQQSRDTLPMEYRYTRASERGGSFLSGQLALYSGGGYVHELRGSSERLLEDVQKLRQQGWIDHRTRAVIVEFTTFNPGTHLFGMTVIKFELPGTGSVLPSYRIEPANLLSFTISGVKAFELTCQSLEHGSLMCCFFLQKILFVIALAGLLIKEGRNLWGERLAYFRTFRSWAQMFILFGSFGAICIYVFVTIEVKKMTLEFYRTNGNGYANFQMVANWNEVLAYLVALITFVAILMFMHIFRFNKNIGLLGAVLSYAYRDMKYFFAVFAIIFFSFVVAFFLLFYDTMDAYCTFISSMETSFQIVLGKFDVKKMYEREPILGPVIFAAFSLFIIFIMLSMFVAILTDSFEVVRKDPALQSHDYELVHFMLARFILWSGFDRFKWAKRILNEYSLSVTEQIYDDDEEHECEKLIAELNDVTDRFVSCVKSSELVGVRDV
ncbi:unnamed protein product [Mesocestoides corti]|uniref:PKD domain-containing protein n=3 Tax=Mesocestoides corti TaxID=53468 RepID=A0A158QTX2_MESCO|nr:unnamed protein product [Mesocestoides corti]